MSTLLDTIGEFLLHCRCERNLSDKTIKAYHIDLCQFSEFIQRRSQAKTFLEVDRHNLRDYLGELTAAFKPRTIKRKVATLKSLFNHLEFEDMIPSNPLRKMRISINEGQSLPRIIALHDVRKLFRHLYTLKTEPSSSENQRRDLLRDIAVIETLFATGVRVSELTHLLLENVDLRRGHILVQGKGKRERLVPICTEETINALRSYSTDLQLASHQRSHFFINRHEKAYSEQSVRLMIRKRVRDAGITTHITPHMFRHTIATLLLGNGTDLRYIQHLLGHSTIATTQIYAHVDDTTFRKILHQRHPRRSITIFTPSSSAISSTTTGKP